MAGKDGNISKNNRKIMVAKALFLLHQIGASAFRLEDLTSLTPRKPMH
jgi:hypothetical protein